jgi:hypothetical protein
MYIPRGRDVRSDFPVKGAVICIQRVLREPMVYSFLPVNQGQTKRLYFLLRLSGIRHIEYGMLSNFTVTILRVNEFRTNFGRCYVDLALLT